jgi:hypothetical protein
MANKRLIGLLYRDGTNLARLLETGRHSILQEVEERVDSGQPGVARARGTSSLGFDVFEEREDKGYIQLLDRQLGWPDLEAAASKADEKLKGVGVGLARVRAGLAVPWQVLPEEFTEMVCERGHACVPPSSISPATATSFSRIGVASRYQ